MPDFGLFAEDVVISRTQVPVPVQGETVYSPLTDPWKQKRHTKYSGMN